MMGIKPQHVFALALMESQLAWAAEGANVNPGYFNSSLLIRAWPLYHRPFIRHVRVVLFRCELAL